MNYPDNWVTNIRNLRLFGVGPMVDETGGNQKIVLTVIFGVGELCAKPLDLEGAHFKMGLERDIDAATEARREGIGSVGETSFAATGVRGSDQKLSKRLGAVSTFQPGLRDTIASADEERGNGEGVLAGRDGPELRTEFSGDRPGAVDIPRTGEPTPLRLKQPQSPGAALVRIQ